MKLLFDESLSPSWFSYCATFSPTPKVHFETGLPVPVIAGFWSTPQPTASSWSRQMTISQVC